MHRCVLHCVVVVIWFCLFPSFFFYNYLVPVDQTPNPETTNPDFFFHKIYILFVFGSKQIFVWESRPKNEQLYQHFLIRLDSQTKICFEPNKTNRKLCDKKISGFVVSGLDVWPNEQDKLVKFFVDFLFCYISKFVFFLKSSITIWDRTVSMKSLRESLIRSQYILESFKDLNFTLHIKSCTQLWPSIKNDP